MLVGRFNVVEPWGLFKGESNKFTNFDEIRDHIVELTNRLCGANKNIVDDPIVPKFYFRS
jgi:hypothetical protein